MHEHDRGDHRDGDRHDDHTQHLADVIELALQRRGLVLGRLEQAGDATHLGAHSRADDDSAPVAIGDRRAAEHHVEAIAERRVGLDLGGDLVDGLALPGEGGLGRPQRGGLEDARVGGDRVALLEQHEIAHDQLAGWNAPSLAVADHRRLGGGQRPQRGDRLFRARLLYEAQRRVEQTMAMIAMAS